ncbi:MULTISPECIES: hypothetical protein [Leuconostoc]|uniref:hypothetical protein n=1 Tax=Leuconostoc TaxID=1243 RepID=UPI000B9D77EE|nr:MULTISPECIES: hypothetical protein [Leuconostoc]MCT4377420.1 hypothetical protein [Leuconostoc suionicum]USI45507.1 hypothetical protein M0D19_08405 [Leuconostoc mesenteroides]BAX73385.1 PAS/PAC sensor hybrid histidine kinase [Leuconostoc mesenteroides]
MTISDEQVAHDKAIAFAQATLLRQINAIKDDNQIRGKEFDKQMQLQVELFDFTYREAFEHFLELEQ